MNVKRVLTAAALAFAGSAFATPTTFAGSSHHDESKVLQHTFESQLRQYLHNHDIYLRYDELGNRFSSFDSIYSVPDSKWPGPGDNNNVAPVPEPETYALMIAGLLVVFSVAHRRRPKS